MLLKNGYFMKLSARERLQGVSYRTAGRWFKAGILPAPAKQLANGTILLSDLLEDSHFNFYVNSKTRLAPLNL